MEQQFYTNFHVKDDLEMEFTAHFDNWYKRGGFGTTRHLPRVTNICLLYFVI